MENKHFTCQFVKLNENRLCFIPLLVNAMQLQVQQQQLELLID
jgi:hypothetical protein